MKNFWRGQFPLLLATLFWGFAFITQTTAMDFVGPFTFQVARQLLGFLVLLPVIAFRAKRDPATVPTDASRKKLYLYGALCGLFLFAACSLQQLSLWLGLAVGKCGFITALYVLLVPILGIFFGKRISLKVACAVVIAVIGLYFLCGASDFSFGLVEFLVLLCALCFAAHILCIDHCAPQVDAVRLAALQFFFCALYSVPFALLTENISLTALLDAWLPIAYTGVFSSGIAYTLQIVGQKNCDPVLASLTMSTESVFTALFGWLVLGQALSVGEIGGSLLMLTAIVLAQLPADVLRGKKA